MTLSVRERVIAAFAARLATVTAPNVVGTLTVYRARRQEIPEGKLPALNMRVTGGMGEQVNAGVTRHVLRVTVEGYAKATTDTDLDSALADLAAAVAAAIESDPTLGGLAVDTNPAGLDVGAADDEGIGGLGGVLAAFDVEFWTRPGDPYALAP